MKHLAFILFGICLLSACKKKEPPASTPAPGEAKPEATVPATSAQNPTPSKPLPPPPQFVSARADNSIRQSISGEVDPFLTQQLRTFVQRKQRLPESFAEFAMTRLDSIPRPPDGKKWAIDTADLSVKSVFAK